MVHIDIALVIAVIVAGYCSAISKMYLKLKSTRLLNRRIMGLAIAAVGAMRDFG
ncbi:hypothetical protein JQ614_33395 [Bradyrhizobium diazoefficiens]|uniref:hypothetical protein n=1 Tax=Bradyrhizobium diazoefficiens TaxID=1355477 RepID=UPI001B8AB8F3|nr:hypothetical protein [Bradyrhizobium diazoefficiens]MBR0891116.1 hypothetical protein [Bradyrhizobium diazoefficiens]MBR0922809.1 hypothetical protein [Bradyrhizobium diazoefficiens]